MRNKRNRKLMSILLTLSLLVTLLVPMVGPASATTENIALSVPSITTGTAKTLGTLQVKETTPGSVTGSVYVTFTFLNAEFPIPGTTFVAQKGGTDPTGAANTVTVWAPTAVSGDINTITSASTLSIISSTKNTVTVYISGVDTAQKYAILRVVASGATVNSTGDVKVNVSAPNTGFSQGDVIVANAAGAGTTTTAISTETVGSGSGKTLGIVRISENTVSALATNSGAPTGTNTVKLTLPNGFTWNTTSGLTSTGFAVAPTVGNIDGRYAYISISAQSSGTPGFIQFAPVVDINSSDATKGDITLTISGSNSGITGADVIIGKYGDFSATATVDSVKEIIAGKADQQIGDITIEESLAASLLNNRTVRLTLDNNAKWHTVPGIEVLAGSNVLNGAAATYTTDAKTIEYTISASSSASKIKLKNATIDSAADISGDVTVTIDGTGGLSAASLKVATAKAPVTAAVDKKVDLKIGYQNQALGDFTITEAKGEALKKSGSVSVTSGATTAALTQASVTRNANLYLEAPTGVTFSNTPTVTVTDGDLQIDTANVRRVTSDSQLYLPIKNTSSKPSTIKISGLKLTVNRDVAEGDIKLKVKGSPAVETGDVFTSATSAAAVVIGQVVTPAPVDTKATAKFKIGDTKFTLNGIEQTMDAAPYIKDSRTYLPLRFVAQAVGVADSNIIWNSNEQSVTLIKSGTVVKLVVGSTTMTINGTPVTMDVAPEIVDPGRTMLPVRWVGQALGANIAWDEATQTVTVN